MIDSNATIFNIIFSCFVNENTPLHPRFDVGYPIKIDGSIVHIRIPDNGKIKRISMTLQHLMRSKRTYVYNRGKMNYVSFAKYID